MFTINKIQLLENSENVFSVLMIIPLAICKILDSSYKHWYHSKKYPEYIPSFLTLLQVPTTCNFC